ncbi:Inner membrane protein ygjV [Citrobacter freundii]|nr:Inner membrane protein ygjV [Citrobacter freundii]
MTAYWLAQGVGVIAFLIGITTFFNRDERRFRLQLAVYSATIGVHFFLMGAWPAGMSAELNTIRTLVSMHTRKLWVMTVFIILTLVLGLGEITACDGAVADHRHAGQHLGAVSLPGVDRALRNVVRNRLLGCP